MESADKKELEKLTQMSEEGASQKEDHEFRRDISRLSFVVYADPVVIDKFDHLQFIVSGQQTEKARW